MRQMTEGKTYPFDSFPVEERIDLLKSILEVYYCIFAKETQTGRKYGLFRNNNSGDGRESRFTDSYTVIGEEFGYDDVEICPTGVYPNATLSAFVALSDYSTNTCQIISVSEADGCHELVSGPSLDECSKSLKRILGMELSFGRPDYFKFREEHFQKFGFPPSADILKKHFDSKYEFITSPMALSHGDTKAVWLVVKKTNGKFNILNLDSESELSPLDFDSEPSVGISGNIAFTYKGVELRGVIYLPGTDGGAVWYPEDYSQFKNQPDLSSPNDWVDFADLDEVVDGITSGSI